MRPRSGRSEVEERSRVLDVDVRPRLVLLGVAAAAATVPLVLARLRLGRRPRIRLDHHRPRVMTTFVRNRLIDEVYLPLLGDSLAGQLGTTAGPGTGGLKAMP